MSCGHSPVLAISACIDDNKSDCSGAWSAAAVMAGQAASCTMMAQRHAAKESLRSHLKSISSQEWAALCSEALHWIRVQVLSSSDSGGIVSAACALVAENTHRCSAQAELLTSAPLSSAQTADDIESFSTSAVFDPLLGLCVSREVAPKWSPTVY
jgi:hypothetical protein